MNQILYYGNNLYSVVSQSLNQDFLLLTEVPGLVDIENDTFHLEYSESFSGALFMAVNNDPYVTLEHAFNEIFFTINHKSCLLTIGMNTVGIIMPFSDVFKIFDSHSRDLSGMPFPSGYCVLTSVEGVQNLVHYFQLTSYNQNTHIPFELKGVKCNKRVDILNKGLQLIVQDKSKSDLKEKKRNYQRDYRNMISQSESSQQKESRLVKECEYKRAQRKNESSEQREERLEKKRAYVRAQRQNQSSEQREEQLAKKRAYMRVQRQNQSSEEKEKRLAQNRT
jgi:hypothetical protein